MTRKHFGKLLAGRWLSAGKRAAVCGSRAAKADLRHEGDTDVDCKRCLGTVEHGDTSPHKTRAECPRCFAQTWLAKDGTLFRHTHARYRGFCPASGLSPNRVSAFKRVSERALRAKTKGQEHAQLENTEP